VPEMVSVILYSILARIGLYYGQSPVNSGGGTTGRTGPGHDPKGWVSRQGELDSPQMSKPSGFVRIPKRHRTTAPRSLGNSLNPSLGSCIEAKPSDSFLVPWLKGPAPGRYGIERFQLPREKTKSDTQGWPNPLSPLFAGNHRADESITDLGPDGPKQRSRR